MRSDARCQAALAWLAVTAALSAVVVFPSRDPASVWPDGAEYAAMAVSLARGGGFRVAIASDLPRDRQPTGGMRNPSRYPPGLPLTLAPFALAARDPARGVQLGSRVLSAVYLLTLFGCAWLLGGPLAAAIAAVLAAGSPFLAISSRLVMSDALGAAAAVAVALVLEVGSRRGGRTVKRYPLAAGLLAGFAVLVRLANVIVPVALLFALRDRGRRGAAVLGVIPGAVGLAAYQWVSYGRPWVTGYDHWFPRLDSFSLANLVRPGLAGDGPWIYPDLLRGSLMSWVCPCPSPGGPMLGAVNVLFYPALLLGLFWVFTPPLVPLAAAGYSLRQRRRESVRFLLCLVAANLVLALPYFYTAARLVAPAASALLVLAAAGLAGLAPRLAVAVQRLLHRNTVSLDDPAS